MPEPIISLQRRLTIVGAIRAGGEKEPKRPGRKLESFRLTSPRRELIEQAAELYGGPVSQWEGPNGSEWQVYTEALELPALVMPGYSLRQTYELWEGATKCMRRCDGIEEELTGGPCICNRDGQDVCDIYTRLTVALPELDTVLGWKLITKGANAAHELPTMMALIEARAGNATFVPARLRIDQRRGVKDGQVVRFVVPTIDLGVGYLALAAGERPAALTPGPPAASSFVPAPDRRPDVRGAIESVSRPAAPPTSTRKSPEMGPRHHVERASTAPLAVDGDQGETPAAPQGDQPLPRASSDATDDDASYSERRQNLYATDAQKAKLNVLVGKLREGGHVTTEGLYLAVAQRLRNYDAGELVEEVGGRDADGVLHWAPLREALLRPEANQLIDWLEVKQGRVSPAAGSGDDSPGPDAGSGSGARRTRPSRGSEAGDDPSPFQPPAAIAAQLQQEEDVQTQLGSGPGAYSDDPFPEGY